MYTLCYTVYENPLNLFISDKSTLIFNKVRQNTTTFDFVYVNFNLNLISHFVIQGDFPIMLYFQYCVFTQIMIFRIFRYNIVQGIFKI